MYDRHHNVYTFSVNEKLIVVKYKKEEVVSMDRPNKGKSLLFMSWLFMKVKTKWMVLPQCLQIVLLMILVVSSMKVQVVLTKSINLMIKEFSQCLPFIQDIQH